MPQIIFYTRVPQHNFQTTLIWDRKGSKRIIEKVRYLIFFFTEYKA